MNLLCGLGHAAGFFQSRGLFGQLQGLKAKADYQTEHAQELIAAQVGSS